MRWNKSTATRCFFHLFCLVSAAQSFAGNLFPRADSYPPDAPAVVAAVPDDHTLSIDEEQIFLLRLSVAATTASIEANAYCDAGNAAGHIPVTVLVDQDRQAMLDQFQLQGESIAVLRCRDPLPSSASVTLHWGAGVATQAGVALKSEQTMQFTVRGPFKASVHCKPAFPAGGCSPKEPIRVSFTAAIDRARAASVRLVGGEGVTFESRSNIGSQETMSEIAFSPPFPPASTLTLVVPSDLTDEAGRTLQNMAEFPTTLRIGALPVFSRSTMVLQSHTGGLLPMNLQYLRPTAGAADSGAALRLLPIDSDPGQVASWLHRVLDEGAISGTCESPQAAGRNVVAEELGAPVGRCSGDRVWVDTTETTSIFREADSPRKLALPGPGKPDNNGNIHFALKQPGLYVAEVAGLLPGAPAPDAQKTRYMSTLAVVTNMAVHVFWRPDGALVWVTRLTDGSPVPGADVTITDYCKGEQLWEGRTGSQGVATSPYVFGPPPQQSGCQQGGHPFLVSAQANGDFSFTLSDWKVVRERVPQRVFSPAYTFGGRPVQEGTKRRLRLPTLGASSTVKTAITEPTHAGSMPTTASSIQLGVREEISSEPGKVRIRVIAATAEDKLVPSLPVSATLYRLDARVGPAPRAKGGFYFFEDVWDTKQLSTYPGVTGNSGDVVLELPTPGGPPYSPLAVRVDARDGRSDVDGVSMYVIDFGEVAWFNNASAAPSMMSALPERPEYSQGEVIRLRPQIPFPTATALVVVERDSILTSFVTRLGHGKTPTVDVPVSPNYAPAVAISVFAISADPAPPGADMGWWNRAHYRLGGACIKISSEVSADSRTDSPPLAVGRPHSDWPPVVDCPERPASEVATMLGSLIDPP